MGFYTKIYCCQNETKTLEEHERQKEFGLIFETYIF